MVTLRSGERSAQRRLLSLGRLAYKAGPGLALEALIWVGAPTIAKEWARVAPCALAVGVTLNTCFPSGSLGC